MTQQEETGFETPSGFDRKVADLAESFAGLVATYPDDKQLRQMARQFSSWQYKATREQSPLSKIFAGSELQTWAKRYQAEYTRLTRTNPKTATGAPIPLDMLQPHEAERWFWPFSVFAGAALLFSLAQFRKRK